MDSVSKKEVLEKVKAKIMSVKGVVGVAELNKEQCETVACLEEKAMENVLSGMGRGRNEGVKDSLSRDVVMVFFSNIDFDIPCDMLLFSEGRIVGMNVEDPDRIKKFKEDKNYVVISDFFVMERGAKINRAAFDSGDAYYVINGVQSRQFSSISEMKDHVVSFPSPPVFDFLKEQVKDGVDLSDPQLGGFLVGFNLS
ncbi:MAG: hypothetical protein H3Z50_03255 [archaeon]|nr:hypothetical protein [archaeon]MCP8306889.1 hypothetical protein [archaeon]